MKKAEVIKWLKSMISEKIQQLENSKTPSETAVVLEIEVEALKEAVAIILRKDL
jgi:hypothetical protein